jgi:hypothetical protein
MLLDNREKAIELGRGAQQTANERFNIDRFKQDWINTFEAVINRASINNKIRISV